MADIVMTSMDTEGIKSCGGALLWLTIALGASSIYIFLLALYRLYLHPLAKHPGPVLAKLTDGYQLFHAWKGDRHLDFWRLHQVYGPVVRFGPNALSFNSSGALKQIYGFKSNVRKAEFYDAFVHPAPNTHNARDKTLHARKRRVLAHGFSDGAMKEMEKYILANVRAFCDQVGKTADGSGAVAETKGWSVPRNMSDWCNYLAMDILGDLCFGKAFHMVERADNRYALDLVAKATKRHLICGTLPLIDKLHLDKLLFPEIAAGRARYMAYSKSQLTGRTKLGDDTDRRDFFYHLLKARDPETGQGFTTPELWGESNLLIIAGSDTTSTAMAATLFYLVRSPGALHRATRQVRDRFDDVEDIHQGQVLGGCTYLRACIDEAMRLSPSVGGLLPREVLEGGMHVDGTFVPEGTVIGVPHYTIHHNTDIYAAPFCYVPERWLEGAEFGTCPTNSDGGGGGGVLAKNSSSTVSAAAKTPPTATVTEEDVRKAQSGFCAFSVGPRGCIGKGLAYHEMMTTLARTLWLYDIRRAPGSDPGEGGKEGAEWGRHRPGEFQLVDTFTSMKDGPMVQFRRRDGA